MSLLQTFKSKKKKKNEKRIIYVFKCIFHYELTMQTNLILKYLPKIKFKTNHASSFSC